MALVARLARRHRPAVPECPACGLLLHVDTLSPTRGNVVTALRLHLMYGCDLAVTS